MTAVSKYSPAPSDVYASMSQIIRQNNEIGVKNIRKLMMQDHPEWLISEKVMPFCWSTIMYLMVAAAASEGSEIY
jgi:hypothetical protein